jgi:hypothetical protein
MSYETEELATGCGKFMFVCFVAGLILVVGAFLIGRSC